MKPSWLSSSGLGMFLGAKESYLESVLSIVERMAEKDDHDVLFMVDPNAQSVLNISTSQRDLVRGSVTNETRLYEVYNELVNKL